MVIKIRSDKICCCNFFLIWSSNSCKFSNLNSENTVTVLSVLLYETTKKECLNETVYISLPHSIIINITIAVIIIGISININICISLIIIGISSNGDSSSTNINISITLFGVSFQKLKFYVLFFYS